MSKLTNFEGWQNDMEYLQDEAECKRRTEWAIAMYKKHMREQEDEARKLSLKWRLTIFFSAGLFGGFVIWAVLTWIIDGVLKAFGR